MAMIKDNVTKITSQIASVCQGINRDPAEITLVGITKYTELPQITAAIQAGINHIGENRVQDARQKFAQLDPELKVVKHLVGHLQTNKAKQAIEVFDLIESVDSLKLAREINKHAAKINKTINILIQINVAEEEQKSGMPVDAVDEFVSNIVDLDFIRVQGLMNIAPFSEDRAVIQYSFSTMRKIFERLASSTRDDSRIEMKYLSMGMSSDFDIALEEGSNMIRIGRAIFHGEG